MKHEDDMTPGEYRRWKKADHNEDMMLRGHLHTCDKCESVWDCPQLWHCKRDLKSTCPDCLGAEWNEKLDR